jgi:muramoyltetrapeptide carboxypeptidase
MIEFPPLLNPGDKIGLIPPASKIAVTYISNAKVLLESWGLDVVLSSNCNRSFHEFAGTDSERLQALQEFLDNKEIKSIFCARGGYGTSRIIDQLELNKFKKSIKWIIGFSDITILLNKLFLNQISSIHGPMPINFSETGASESLKILRQFLFDGSYPEITFNTRSENIPGYAEGPLVGGNLSMLIHSIGTSTHINTEGKILVIEDIDERLYRIDRMVIHLQRAGVFDGLKGLIVGHFSRIDDTRTFGYSLHEIILKHTQK